MAAPKAGFWGPIEILKLGAGRTFALLVVFTKSIVCSCASSREHTTASSPKPNSPASAVHPHHFPFRFVWQTDADTHFSVANQEFADLLGPNTAGVLGRSWPDIAQALNFDPQGQIANAIAARETFSGIVLLWPVDDVDERLPVEMSGLPVFNRDRQFKGFRGFGICRDLDRLQEVRQRRMPEPSPQTPPPAEATSKILPFHPTPKPSVEEPKLNLGERSAFQELARELSERLTRTSSRGPRAGSGRFRLRTSHPDCSTYSRADESSRRRSGHAANSRSSASRHPDLPAEHVDVCEPRVPRVDRLSHPGSAQ